MPCEIVGLHFHADSSEIRPLRGVYDAQFVSDCAIAHEQAGFDRVLVGQTATWPDGIATVGHLTAVTTRLKFMIAHRPGFVAPTMAARAFATLDQLSHGRVGVHIITGASDVETRCDGDYLTKAERYHRSAEYVDILRAIWNAPAPIDHHGRFYRFDGGFAEIKPVQAAIPVFWGGASDLAIELGAQSADVYAIGPGPLMETAALISRFRTAAAHHGRVPGVSMSMRVIIGQTEEAAWIKAQAVLDGVLKQQAGGAALGRDKGVHDRGTAAALAIATRGDVLDERLWTGIVTATQARLHATALVGTAPQVADALLRYYDIGVDRFLLNGFFGLADICLFGEELIPLIRAGVAARDTMLAKASL